MGMLDTLLRELGDVGESDGFLLTLNRTAMPDWQHVFGLLINATVQHSK